MHLQPQGFAGRPVPSIHVVFGSQQVREGLAASAPPLSPQPDVLTVASSPTTQRRWSTWTPGLATTVTALAALGTSAAVTLWQSDNSTAALTYGAMACMGGAVLLTHQAQAAWAQANQSTQRTLDTASELAARAAEEVLPQLTRTIVQAIAEIRSDVALSLEDTSRHVHRTFQTATQSTCSIVHRLGRTAGVMLGTVTALYVLGRLGAPVLLGAAAGQGLVVLLGVMGTWSLAMVVLGWWLPNRLL